MPRKVGDTALTCPVVMEAEKREDRYGDGEAIVIGCVETTAWYCRVFACPLQIRVLSGLYDGHDNLGSLSRYTAKPAQWVKRALVTLQKLGAVNRDREGIGGKWFLVNRRQVDLMFSIIGYVKHLMTTPGG